jgi:hypothetical protein
MQRYTICFIIANALPVSGGFSAHHQEFKKCTHSIWCMPSLLAATASVGESETLHKIRVYAIQIIIIIIICT